MFRPLTVTPVATSPAWAPVTAIVDDADRLEVGSSGTIEPVVARATGDVAPVSALRYWTWTEAEAVLNEAMLTGRSKVMSKL